MSESPRTPSPDHGTVRDDLRTTPRLLQAEFCGYVLFILYGFYQLIATVAAATQRFRSECSARTLPSSAAPWLGPGVDDHDPQWRAFRTSAPPLLAFLVAWVAVSRLARHTTSPRRHAAVLCAMGLAFVVVSHGRGAVPVLLLQGLNFLYSRLHGTLPYAVYLGGMWAMHVALLLINENSNGWEWAFVGQGAPLRWADGLLGQGFFRWQVCYNMSTLRMLGYNYDRWAASNTCDERRRTVAAAHGRRCLECAESGAECYKLRAEQPRPEGEFTLANYAAFVNYVPLYVAGPMSSYAAFMSHLSSPQRVCGPRRLAAYAARIAFHYALLQVLLHFAHVNCFREVPGLFLRMTPKEQAVTGYLTLAFLWLKFNVIWKLFRAVGLLDGVEAPEDMPQCFSNTTTVGDFWRRWHASFNLWIVRYMYIPLGGRRNRVFSVLPIFLFIALWHDTTLHLLYWAFLMAGVFVVEVSVSALVSAKGRWLKSRPYWRHIAAAGGTSSSVMLIIANLYGYGTKMSSTEGVRNVFEADHVVLAAFSVFYFYCMNHVGNVERRFRARQVARRRKACSLVAEPHNE